MKLKDLIPYLNVNAIEIECGKERKKLDSTTTTQTHCRFFEEYLNKEIISIKTSEAKIVLKI